MVLVASLVPGPDGGAGSLLGAGGLNGGQQGLPCLMTSRSGAAVASHLLGESHPMVLMALLQSVSGGGAGNLSGAGGLDGGQWGLPYLAASRGCVGMVSPLSGEGHPMAFLASLVPGLGGGAGGLDGG